ncbi:protein kinase domain-containing protein [Sarocladium implicatum]|nr:protein kinase domain-containing protein [Sarocladium implicatum]
MEGEEPTQATQDVLDPRRLGQQNSGFSDEDISDIVCILYPHSESARQEVLRLARENNPHVIGRTDADGVDPDYDLEDHASHFGLNDTECNYALILRLSATVTDPAAGFVFGRNALRCDVVFVNDPNKRISNVHFRIYVNKHGSVMVEDQSTNGTVVDDKLLESRPKDPNAEPVFRWMLNSGSVIQLHLHKQIKDITFRVRIPRRDSVYDEAYMAKVQDYFERHGLEDHANTLDAKSPTPVPAIAVPKHLRGQTASPQKPPRGPVKRQDSQGVVRREWTGSGKYNRIGNIGKGAFAVVYKVASKYDGTPYAAKELEKQRFIRNGVLDQKVENEMKIMQCINHPNIVRYVEHIDWDDRLLIIIMEYVAGGDLGRHISETSPLDEDSVKIMAGQLLAALGYLHVNKITHRDVKPDNILISSLDPLSVKLTDFGLSKMVNTEQTFLRTFCGTLLYCAPEVYTEYTEYDEFGVRNRGKKGRRMPGQRYDHAVDIWSLGGVLFYTLTGSPPYPVNSGISHSELLHKIMTTQLNTLPLRKAGVSEEGVDFLSSMLQKRPNERATIQSLIDHPWLAGPVASSAQASQSMDEFTDEEDLGMDLDTFRQPEGGYYEEDRISDSIGYDSDQENEQFEQPRPGGRLFGEVGVSAIGSSGAIPSDLLNLHMNDTSMGGTEILDSYEDKDDGYGSESDTPRKQGRTSKHGTTVSIVPNQSADQLESLVFDVASQSLGGKDSTPSPPAGLRSMSFKRKPPSTDTSGEFEENLALSKPTMKRLKSETALDSMPEDMLEELRLIASVPAVKRLTSGRQIDSPVPKVIFWEQDRLTWHLNYPEMTQLQSDAFKQAAKIRGEEFKPGRSPLWGLAMKYFPPSNPGTPSQSRPTPTMRRNEGMLIDGASPPPTAAAGEALIAGAQSVEDDSLPDTQNPDNQIVVPIQTPESSQRAIAILESSADSVVPGISLPVVDSLISFGRGPDNTQTFEPSSESRVPKYAFKIVLWKDDDSYDPSKDPSKVPPPWQDTNSSLESDSYSFWVSTKATVGIQINGYHIASSEPKNPLGASRFWARLHDKDELEIWGGAASDHTKLIFRCFWGGSTRPRDPAFPGLEIATPDLAHKLNTACQRTERRLRDSREKEVRQNQARQELAHRYSLVERERERSRIFEEKRREAVEILAQAQSQSARRGSPAVLSSTGQLSRAQHQPHYARGLSRADSDKYDAHSIR